MAEAATRIHTAPAGLEAATAGQRLAEHGPILRADTAQKTAWQILLHQLADVMMLVVRRGRLPTPLRTAAA